MCFATLICAFSNQTMQLIGFVFVHDTSLCIMKGNRNWPHANKMQVAMNSWEGLLLMSRCTLVPEKCFWYSISFNWHNEKWNFDMMQEQQPGDFHIKDEDGQIFELPCLATSEARQT